jgi:hypothetical protein
MPQEQETDFKTRFHSVRCGICGSDRVHYAFSIGSARVLQCSDCKFSARTEPIPSEKDGFFNSKAIQNKIFEIEHFLTSSFDLQHPTEYTFANWKPDGSIDPITSKGLIVSVGQLHALANPLPSLEKLREALPDAGNIVFIINDVLRTQFTMGTVEWQEQFRGYNTFLSSKTALTVIFRAGFNCIAIKQLRLRTTLQDALMRDDVVISYWKKKVYMALPHSLRHKLQVSVRSNQVAILAKKRKKQEPLVSVIMPVYNESKTLSLVIDSVLNVKLDGAHLELIIVESNSTDGSRDLVQKYTQDPRVTVILEERPHGKGHATRLGLSRANGDIFLIQDADLEYDIEDYHSLLNPIIQGHEAFVLGSRHGGKNHWKLRQFGKPFLSSFYNLAHVMVTAYINLLFGLRLKDPQTMFKVFRRDCIEGLDFHANYFNFDYELLLKIVRKGYVPFEVPVNYRSRSHAEGKKIRMWRDAPLGLWMITKLRLTRLCKFLRVGEPIV